jgi:lipoprotein-anchoring transpeptidase ErfK/SrfK
MKKIWLVVVILAILVVGLVWKTRPWWISAWQFSPQHTVDPATVTAEFDRVDRQAVFDNRSLLIPTSVFSAKEPNVNVLGDTSQAKRIEVDLTNQRLMAYEGDQQIYNFLISSGKWGRTPTGNFRIWIKLRYTKMSGGSKALNTYYYLPNVPYVMYFYNDEIPKWRGYGLHGTYWHSNFGHPMSHGCINMKTEEAGLLYQWANPNLGDKASGYASEDNPGTEIVIYGDAPWE